MRKVCMRSVPRKLWDLLRKECMGEASEFLTMYQEEDDALFDHIIMGDETWVHYWTTESKAVSMQWKHKDEKTPFKKLTRQYNSIWDIKGVT